MGRPNLRGAAPVGGFNLVEIKDGVHERLRAAHRPADQAVRGTRSSWRSTITPATPIATPALISRSTPAIRRCRPRWTYNTGYTIASTPAVWKDLAIVGDASGRVYALSLKTGKVQWEFKTQNAVYSTPDVSGDLVVFGSTDGNIYALQAANGKEAWRYTTGRPIVACPRINDGTVYIGSSEGTFRALNLASGKLTWQFDGLPGFVETKPLVYDGKVIAGAWDEHLYALDARDREAGLEVEG